MLGGGTGVEPHEGVIQAIAALAKERDIESAGGAEEGIRHGGLLRSDLGPRPLLGTVASARWYVQYLCFLAVRPPHTQSRARDTSSDPRPLARPERGGARPGFGT